MQHSRKPRAAIGLFLCSLVLFPASLRAEEILVDPALDTTHWVLTGQRVSYTLGQSKLEAVKQPARPGMAGSLKLTYDLERRGWIGIQWRGEPIAGRVESASFWLLGDGQKQRLSVRIEDAASQTYDVPLGTVDWEGWRQLQVPMDESKWQPVRRFGAETLPVRWPVAIREVRINRGTAQPPLSSVCFSELRAVRRIEPLDRLNVRITSDAPANVFYLPEPVALRVTLENPTEASLSGRLETVVEDWLGRSERFEHGTVTVAPKASLERSLQIPLKSLGSYQVWGRLCVGDRVCEASQALAVSRKVTGPAVLDPSSPFGMGLYLSRFRDDASLAQALVLAREAGVKWTRDGLSPSRFAPTEGRLAWEWPYWVAGKKGGAVEFSPGLNLTIPSSASLNRPSQTGELTLAFWIRFAKFDYPDRWRSLLTKGDGPNRQHNLFLNVATRQLGVSFGDGVKSWQDVLCTKTDWKTGQWYHVVMTQRRSDRRVRWWVDGQPAGESKARFDVIPVASDGPLVLGQSLEAALDELAIYDQSLSPAELTQGKPVACWTFDEQQGLRVGDSSGNGNDAVAQPFGMDPIVEQATAAGISSYCIFMGTPPWMAGRSTEGMARPRGVMPRPDAWSAVVEAAVRRYAARGIHTWEVWNEPNLESFWSPKPDPEEYSQVLAASYAAIKKADPQATVLGCSLAGPHGARHRPPYEFVEEVLKRGGGKVMDAISIHPYRQPRAPEDSEYLDDLRAISDLTAKYGRRLPIWITEVGWNNGVGGSSERWSAKMIVRSYLLAIAAGVKNVTWYDYRDDGTDPSYNEHHFGILRHDLTPKPAYFAYRAMATELVGMQFEREIRVGEGMSVLVFRSGDRRTAVAWSHRDEVPIAWRLGAVKEIECVDLMGNASRQAVRDGALPWSLTDAPMFVRNVPESLDVVLPIRSSPGMVKLYRGQSGQFSVTLRNPLDRVVELSAPGQKVALPANGERLVPVHVSAKEAAAWQPPVWRDAEGLLTLTTPTRVIALAGQHDPIFQYDEETSRPTSVPDSTGLHASDEVTIACRLRCDGPGKSWQTPVAKARGEDRNYSLFLGREKGEFCFSASFEKGAYLFTDVNSGVTLFDGKWHAVAVTYSKYDAEVCFYVDGKLVKRQPMDGGDLKSNDAPIVIGNGFAAPRAAVQGIQIWNRALSAEDVSGLKP